GLLARRRGAPALARLSAAPVQARLRAGEERLAALAARLDLSAQDGRAAREGRARLEALAARLEAVSYGAVLRRGFALVQDAAGAAVTSAAAVAPGAALTLTFGDGQAQVRAEAPARQGQLL
ncbi:exodeoxyribonuclease VII large subunit, partial [Roseococcus sp. DSY-14]|uniref:exodeoxyribonuclease VII large subunit n=1 Tax=Roseococcus sp. DSY-14 TaxID=3369650 RepID=UPI00387AB024